MIISYDVISANGHRYLSHITTVTRYIIMRPYSFKWLVLCLMQKYFYLVIPHREQHGNNFTSYQWLVH